MRAGGHDEVVFAGADRLDQPRNGAGIVGTVAIVVPGLPRLKEWAYAGIFFDLTGAAASHAASGDAAWHIAAPLILAILAVASWALRPPSRIIGTLVGVKGGQA